MATIDIAALTRLSDAALVAAGLSAADAARASRILVEGEMMGLATHGVIRLPGYCARLTSGGVDAGAEIAVDRRAPSLALIDGGNGLGPVVGMAALDVALDMAAETGIAWTAVRRSNHFGALAPYALRALDAGLVLVAGTNATVTMAPWGGSERRMGNNPLCIAAPCSAPPHFLLDMATSMAARGRIRAARDAGEPIPAGWAVDEAGRPTTDPVAALRGMLSPVGGHKGSGLALAVDMLAGALSGASFLTGVSGWDTDPGRPQGLGHFFLAVDPERVCGRTTFVEAMDRFRDTVRTTPPVEASAPVLLPGEREQALYAAAQVDGVTVADDLLDEIRALAGG